jgi:deoxyribodipyrimidine photo-lyase
MVAARRPRFNFALEHAVGYARELGRPLLVFEPLRASYPWASPRLHTFVVQGMAANAAHFAKTTAHYYPYLEPRRGAGAGLLAALAARACLVVTDDYPGFFLPRMVGAAARALAQRVEAVDGAGLLPLALAEGKSFYNAYHFRRFMQKHVARELEQVPSEDPLRRKRLPALAKLPKGVERRWPPVAQRALQDVAATVAALPLSSRAAPVPSIEGGHRAARQQLEGFVAERLPLYARQRNHPDAHAASGLSPYLHFGHLGVHEILAALHERERWDGVPRGLARDGKREGFWGLSATSEAFLDELVTFRELALNTAATMADFDRYEALPAWARATLEAHAGDRREHVYSLAQFEAAATHDPLWNAAQRELLVQGRIHNYLRMLWGKQILAWSQSPRHALEIMIELNNRYALDGRDPNSYAGIFWVLGRYDRPWAPERAVFGSIRYMTSGSAQRKLTLKNYLVRHIGAKSGDA